MLKRKAGYPVLMLALVFVLAVMMVHASPGHGQPTITPLAAARKGMEKMDELIHAKKLDAHWADTFTEVAVSTRNIKGFAEYVLKFRSTSGSPAEVSLYFNFSGGFTGSNLGD